MSHPIRAPYRFSLLAAFLLLAGIVVAELIASSIVDVLFIAVRVLGGFSATSQNPDVEATLTIL